MQISRIAVAMSKNPKVDVLNYMTRENRPFSVNDVVAALQKAHGKTAISKAIDELVLEDSLVEKVYGKQKVFVVSQDKLPRPDGFELKAMDEEINNLTTKLQQLKDRIKLVESELESVQSSLSLEEARDQNAIIEAKIEEIKKLIDEYGSEVPVTPEEFTQAETRQKTAVAEWRKRKRMAMDIIEAVAESYPKSRKELMEDIGIETDEDRGVSIADFTS
ncbi:Homologous-pairing protein 2 [Echinococcus granulosus]|uniref:Homologous-pairing protein 2 homolog n=2 Tax=Echinococcus granulosus TaxID=6210 RepID=W6UNE3_ECHGR|nr:Homologous-pairing protein 2 [Echinococcus granulosus]EUB62693.1 Homologous-pairing protein 2 [Echinococcus granulosus]